MRWKDVTRAHLGWGFYDWANSSFATTILAFIWVKYFVDAVARGQDGVDVFGVTVEGSTLWPITIVISFILIILISPMLGAMADHLRMKKRFLMFFCYLGAAATIGLFFVAPGSWVLGMILFMVANMGFIAGNVFYNGLMKDISDDESIGYLSGLGWGLGYLGGFALLIINMLMIFFWKSLHFTSQEWAVRSTFLTVGVWWVVFSIPLFLFVKESRKGAKEWKGLGKMTMMGYKEVFGTVKHIPKYPVLLVFLISFFLFHDAIETTISQTTNYVTSVLELDIQMILWAALLIQFVAIIGSFGFILIEKKVGTKRTLVIALIIWVVLLLWAFMMQHWIEFYIIAVGIGLVLGVSQSAARTLFGLFIPKEKAAEFFSFYSISGKVSSLIGPLLFALVDFYFDTRYAILPVVLLMVVGLVILLKVDVKKGIEQAQGKLRST